MMPFLTSFKWNISCISLFHGSPTFIDKPRLFLLQGGIKPFEVTCHPEVAVHVVLEIVVVPRLWDF